MRRNNGLAFAVLLNAVLLLRFSYRNVQLLEQIKAASNEIANFEGTEVKLQDVRHEMNRSMQEANRVLRSNYVRLKEMTEYTRRYQIRIKGIPENNGENLLHSMKEIGEHMNIPISESDVTRINRVGTSSKKGSPRVVMVELSDLKLKAKMLAKASTALLNTPYSLQDDVTNHVMSNVFAKVEAEREFSDGCGYISAVSKPTTVARSKKTFGAWLLDYEAHVNGSDNIWILPHFYENNVVEEYSNINNLKHRRIQNKYHLPYNWAGTGHVVLNGCLYFIKFDTNVIIRYEFASKSILKEKAIPKALYGNDAPYQWSGSTDIDLSVDSTGLYAIYATYENTMDIVIGRIDPVSLEQQSEWTKYVKALDESNGRVRYLENKTRSIEARAQKYASDLDKSNESVRELENRAESIEGAESCDELRRKHRVTTSGYYLLWNRQNSSPNYIYCDFTEYTDVSTCMNLTIRYNVTMEGYYLFGMTSNQIRQFQFCSPVFQGIYTCQRLHELYAANESGFYKFQSQDMEPFRVYCDFSNNSAVTEVHHNRMGERRSDTTCEDAFCYSVNPDYGATLLDLARIVVNSISCKQFIKVMVGAAISSLFVVDFTVCL